jgi:hypothetical protein
MKSIVGIGLLLLGCAAGAPAAQDAGPRVFILAGKKTHGPGEHDHPRFLEEWVPLLKSRGARADGGMEFPSAEKLAETDVLVIFRAEGGTMSPDERARLDAYLKRGGGIVVLHDGVCGNDAPWFKTFIGSRGTSTATSASTCRTTSTRSRRASPTSSSTTRSTGTSISSPTSRFSGRPSAPPTKSRPRSGLTRRTTTGPT